MASKKLTVSQSTPAFHQGAVETLIAAGTACERRPDEARERRRDQNGDGERQRRVTAPERAVLDVRQPPMRRRLAQAIEQDGHGDDG